MVHGLIVVAFSAFTLLTPLSDERGFLIDGYAFALLCAIVGWQISFQAIRSRRFARGWWVLLAAGLHAVAAAIAFWVLCALALPYALLWSIVSFMLLEGVILAIGLLWSPVYRMWGILMGVCLLIAALIMMFAWLADPGRSFDVPDAAMGVGGLLYGFAMFVAALQARAAAHRVALK